MSNDLSLKDRDNLKHWIKESSVISIRLYPNLYEPDNFVDPLVTRISLPPLDDTVENDSKQVGTVVMTHTKEKGYQEFLLSVTWRAYVFILLQCAKNYEYECELDDYQYQKMIEELQGDIK